MSSIYKSIPAFDYLTYGFDDDFPPNLWLKLMTISSHPPTHIRTIKWFKVALIACVPEVLEVNLRYFSAHLVRVFELRRAVVSDETHCLHGTMVEVRGFPINHLNHHDPQRPHVNLCIPKTRTFSHTELLKTSFLAYQQLENPAGIHLQVVLYYTLCSTAYIGHLPVD